jgi:hypothetical protein
VVPPFVGVAVKVTLVPEQIVVAVADMLTLAVTLLFTVIVIAFEVAGLPLTQLALEVIMQVMTSPLTRALLLYVELLVPTLLPFFFHW